MRNRKPFDIRTLFAPALAQEYSAEEEVYEKIEERKRRKHNEDQRILSESETDALRHINMEMVRSDVRLPVERDVATDTTDDESSDNSDGWKIHVLGDLVRRDRLNTEARIKLSRLLGGDEGRRVLLDGVSTGDVEIWREIVDRYYSSDMFGEALKVRNGDEDFYRSLFLKEMDTKALEVGIERNPGSLVLRMAMIDALEDPAERQRFVYDSVVCTKDERLIKPLVETLPERPLMVSLYMDLKREGVYLDEMFLYFLGGDTSTGSKDDGTTDMVLNDLFDTGLARTLHVLSRCKRVLELPARMLGRKEVLGYIRTIQSTPMEHLPPHLDAFFTSVSKHGLHDDDVFISCYSVVKQYILDAGFIDRFFVMSRRRYFVDLMKAKEYWKLFVREGDIRFFRRADRILCQGTRMYGKNAKTFVLARSKMYYNAGEYHTAYSVIPRRMRTIRRYVVLSQMDLSRAVEMLRSDLFDYKHHLLYAELSSRNGESPDGIYMECMERYPENAKVGLAYLRYLKMRDLSSALEMSDALMKRFKSDECLGFERFVILRKLRRPSLSALYNSRKYLKSQMIECEIKYYENKPVGDENGYVNYYNYKRACIKECNVSGMCEECMRTLGEYYRNMIMRHPDNGDNYLIYYCVVGSVTDELKRMIEFFDPREGNYWVRVRNVRDISARVCEGSRVLLFDLVD